MKIGRTQTLAGAGDGTRHRMLGKLGGFLASTLALTLTAPVTACDGMQSSQAHSQNATVRDSAGIEIVENHSPRHGTRFWTVNPQPRITIGGPGGDATPGDSSFLAWIIADMGRLSDGRVAVLSLGEKRLLLFEPSGKLSSWIGRAGEGPGEFRYPRQLQVLAGDKLPLPDGSFIVEVPQQSSQLPPVEVLFRPSRRFMRVDSAYAAHSFGHREAEEQMRIKFPPVWPFPLFPVAPHIAVGGSPWSVYISNGDRNEVQEFSPAGVLQRVIRRTADPIAITDQEREQAEAFAANARRGLPTDHLPRQEFHPPVNGLLVDTEGHLCGSWTRWASGASSDETVSGSEPSRSLCGRCTGSRNTWSWESPTTMTRDLIGWRATG